MSSKLALIVNFLGNDKMSGAVRNIVRDAKEGTRGLKGMAREAAGLERELAGVQRELAKGSGNVTDLINRERTLERQLERTNAAMASQRQQIERIQSIQSRAGKIGDAAMTAGVISTAAVTVPVVAGLKSSIEAAMEVQELNSAFAVTFGKQSAAMMRWAEQTGDAMGRSTQEMEDFANNFGLLFTKTAAPEKAAEMSRAFAVLAQDLSSFYNTDTKTAMERLMSGLSGEAEPMRKFGVFLSENAVKAKAMAMGLTGVGNELTEQEKIMARYQLILDGTKNAQGDVARTSGSATNKLRELKGQWQEQQVAIGSKLLPLIPPLADALIGVLTAFNNLSPATQKYAVYLAIAGAAIGPMLMGIGGLAFAVKNVAGTIGGAVTLFKLFRSTSLATAPAFGILKNVLWAVSFAAKGFGRAMLVAGRALLMNPIGLLVTAIGVAAYLIYSHWGKIKSAFASAISYLGSAWAWLKANAGQILQFAGPIGAAASLVIRHWGAIKTAFSNALTFVGGIAGRFMAAGRAIIDGLVSGITSAPGRIWAALKRIIGGAWDSAKKFLGINSPSRLFMAMGGHISTGLAHGIDRGGRQPLGSMKRLAAGVAAAGAMTLAPAHAASPMGGGGTGGGALANVANAAPVTIHVYGAAGQDVNALADIVMRRLESAQGVRRRSAFEDG